MRVTGQVLSSFILLCWDPELALRAPYDVAHHHIVHQQYVHTTFTIYPLSILTPISPKTSRMWPINSRVSSGKMCPMCPTRKHCAFVTLPG